MLMQRNNTQAGKRSSSCAKYLGVISHAALNVADPRKNKRMENLTTVPLHLFSCFCSRAEKVCAASIQLLDVLVWGTNGELNRCVDEVHRRTSSSNLIERKTDPPRSTGSRFPHPTVALAAQAREAAPKHAFPHPRRPLATHLPSLHPSLHPSAVMFAAAKRAACGVGRQQRAAQGGSSSHRRRPLPGRSQLVRPVRPGCSRFRFPVFSNMIARVYADPTARYRTGNIFDREFIVDGVSTSNNAAITVVSISAATVLILPVRTP